MFSVTNRIWLILVFVVFVLGFTSYILLSSSSYSAPLYTTTNLKSKNYLNTTEPESNPFEIYGPEDKIGVKYGSTKLSKSRLHLGSTGRISEAQSNPPPSLLLATLSQLAMALATTLSPRNAIPPSFSSGGTLSFPTLCQSSLTTLYTAPPATTLLCPPYPRCYSLDNRRDGHT